MACAERVAVNIAVESVGGYDRLTEHPAADLQILRHDGLAHLTFRVQFEMMDEELERTMPVVFVDAHSGDVVWSCNNLKHAAGRSASPVARLTPGMLLRVPFGRPAALLLALTLAAACTRSEPELLARLGPPPPPPSGEDGAWVTYTDGHCEHIPPEQWAREQAEAQVRARKDAEEYRDGCQQGDPASCSLLAWAYEGGRGVAVDAAAAQLLHARAAALDGPRCDAVDGAACDGLASAHRFGWGVPKDEARAAALGKRAMELSAAACARGDGEGCRREAHKYFVGEDAEKDRVRAEKLYARAIALLEAGCAAGHAAACDGAFGMLATGDGVPEDRARAEQAIQRSRVLHEKACASGDAAACRRARQLAGR